MVEYYPLSYSRKNETFSSKGVLKNRQKDASWAESHDMKKSYNEGYEDKDKELRSK